MLLRGFRSKALAAIASGYVGIAVADYVSIERPASIKTAPSANADVLFGAEVAARFLLLDDGRQTRGYYRVQIDDAVGEGWVYRTRVRRHAGDIPPTEPAPINAGFDGHSCGRHLMWGIPLMADAVLCRDGYALGYDFGFRTPSWVSYYLTNESAHGTNVPREDRFLTDRELPREFRSGPSDYERSGFDRGHMAPSAAIDYSRRANDQTFLYSNMAPQAPVFNRNSHGHTGAWGALEDRVRSWVRTRELLVIAGTYAHGEGPVIGRGVRVPDAFYKIIYDPVSVQAIAFWMPQDIDSAHQLHAYVKTIDQIEEWTGADFLAPLTDQVELVIESSAGVLALWDR